VAETSVRYFPDLSGITLPKTRKGKITFQNLLQAAEDVFGEKGYHEASVVEVTMRAGVAQGTFYVYFKGKKDIFTQLIIHLHHDVRKSIQQEITSSASRLEEETRGIVAFFLYLHKHANLYKILRDAESVDENLYRWYYHSFAEGYIKRLQKAMAKGEIRQTDPEALAYCLMGIGTFTAMRWPGWEGRMPPESFLDGVRDFIIRALSA
jgi:AcrR family transcriptional regulator